MKKLCFTLIALLLTGSLFASPILPTSKVYDYQGNAIKLHDPEAEVTMLVFWATWCVPCLYEIPHLISLQEKYADRGLRIVSVSVDDNAQEVADFVSSRPLPYPIVYYGHKENRDFTKTFDHINSIPTVFFYDSQGNLMRKTVGYNNELDMENMIRPFIGLECIPDKKSWWERLLRR